jgi:eukaryotic-like serine/threonine-protein kinase
LLYEFEEFALDPVRRVLTRQGETISLPPKAVATLLVLVERHGQVVEKDELFQTVWPHTFISEATLTQNIFRLRKTLGEEAGEHRFIVTVPGRGYSFVAEVRPVEAARPLAVEPPAPASPQEDTAEPIQAAAADAFEPAPLEPPPAAPEVPVRVRWRPRRPALLGAAALLLAGLAAALLFFHFPSRPTGLPGISGPRASAVPRTSIAVLGFRNLSGRAGNAWLSTALAEMFTVELGIGETLHTIPGESVTRTKRDLGLNDLDNLPAGTLVRLRGLLGCDTVLVGSYLALGPDLRVDLRLQDTASGETLSVLTATRSQGDLFELVSHLGSELRQKLGTGPVPRTQRAATRATFPSKREAGRLYSEGLEHLRALDTFTALSLLQRATQAEPDFPLAHNALAGAWAALGYDANAVQEAARALALANNLPREDRLLIEAQYAENRRDWTKAVGIYDSLWRFFPDNLEHGLRLARAQVTAGNPKRALLTIAGLRRLPAPLSDDPRIDLAEAETAAALSDYTGQENASRQAADKGRRLGARLLTAQALHLHGHALRSLGRQREALAQIEEAERIFSAAGDTVGVGRAIHDVANLLRDRGDFEEARRQYERSLAIHRRAGNRRGIVLALTNLGGIELQTGSYGEAQRLLEEVVAISREVHDPLGEGRGLANLGSVLQEQGNLEEARRSLESALGRFRSIGNLLGEAGVRMSLSAVYLDLGKLPEAETEAATAVRLSRQIGHPRSLGLALRKLGLVLVEEGRLGEAEAAYREMEDLAGRTAHKQLLADAQAGMAQVQRFQGKLAEARQNAGAALALWTETDERQQAAAGRLVLARLALDGGMLDEADRQANAAVDGYRALQLADGEALAREVLAEILLARRLTGPADREIHRSLELIETSQNKPARLRIAITAGRAAGLAGKNTATRRTLLCVRAESTALHLRLSQLDATFALAELDLRQGNPAGGRALQKLHDEAARGGFLLVAQRTRILLQGAEGAAGR